MPLIRHIAGIPTATEQRCVRCCEVISRRDALVEEMPYVAQWPGAVVVCDLNESGDAELFEVEREHDSEDCKPVDLSEREDTI